jgi:hypothetical protein
LRAANRLRFALEALLHLGVVGEVRWENLDRDRAVQPRVGRLVHLAHGPPRKRGDDLVRPVFRTGLECHWGSQSSRSKLSQSTMKLL